MSTEQAQELTEAEYLAEQVFEILNMREPRAEKAERLVKMFMERMNEVHCIDLVGGRLAVNEVEHGSVTVGLDSMGQAVSVRFTGTDRWDVEYQ